MEPFPKKNKKGIFDLKVPLLIYPLIFKSQVGFGTTSRKLITNRMSSAITAKAR